MFGAALVVNIELVVPGVGSPLAQELPKSLSSEGLSNCADGPPPLAATGQGNWLLKFTSSITSFRASRNVISSPSLLRPPTHGPNAVIDEVNFKSQFPWQIGRAHV